MTILSGLLMIALVAISLFLVLIVLMQRGSANGGLGSAMGGGAAESALGADSGDVLSRMTTKVAIVFFVLVLGLNLLILSTHSKEAAAEQNALPEFAVPEGEEALSAEDQLTGLVTDAIAEKRAAEAEASTETEAAVADVTDAVEAEVEDASVIAEEALPVEGK
tara:strand:- start:2096 stop:2587 length:492 start_codon:yes stop_codon:yes gene_type:complete